VSGVRFRGRARGRWAALVLACVASVAHAAKTDIVYMRNGDHLTCEIKNLERGQLRLSTDDMGTINVQWGHVARVISSARYIVELQDGSRLQGSLADTSSEGKLLLRGESSERLLDIQDVVWIDPLKLDAERIKRWDGSVSVGFDAAKADSQNTLTMSFDARQRAEKHQINVNGSLYSNHRSDASDSVRINGGAVYRGLLKNRWFWAGIGTAERNDELGIDLRTLVGAGYGRFIVQTGRTLWSVTGGIAGTNEQRAGSQGAANNAEAFVGTDYEYFTYDTPKTKLTVSFAAYPSLTEGGRIRSDLNFAWNRELVKDFFVGLSFYYSYDSVPPDVGAKDDYGVVTSLGYSF
jgi:hypothetical protein